MIQVLIKIPYFWGLRPWSQSHKNAIFLRTATLIVLLFISTYFWMFIRLWSWSQSSLFGLRSYRNPHKNDMFLSFYRTAIMIAVLFIRIATTIAVLIKISYFWTLLRLRSWSHFSLLRLRPWLQSTKMSYFLVFIKGLRPSSQSSQKTVIWNHLEGGWIGDGYMKYGNNAEFKST